MSRIEQPINQVQHVIDIAEEILRSLVPAEVAEYCADNPPPSDYNFCFERGTNVTKAVTVEETELERRNHDDQASKSSDGLVKTQKRNKNKKTSLNSISEDGQRTGEPRFGVVVSGTVTIQCLDRPEEPPKNIDFKFDCPDLEPRRVWVNGRWRDL